MDFLKKHYEKLLLGVMLVGLIGVLVFMLFFIASDRDEMAKKSDPFINPSVKALTNLDTTVEEGAVTRMKSPYVLDFETTNRLLNPMDWKRTLDGTLVTDKMTGPQVAVVTNITPLYLILSLDSITTNEAGAYYVIKMERQAAAKPAMRYPQKHSVAVGDKSKPDVPYTLARIQGPAENPDFLVLKLDTGEEETISKDKAYRRVEGYAADFRYDPERRVFHNVRVNDKIAFGGVTYTAVEVNQNELILMDQSNQKKTSLPFVP